MTVRRAATVAASTFGTAAVLWVLWGPVAARALHGAPLSRCLKNFYVPDQYSVLGIAANARQGLPIYSEPFSAAGDSIYPSGYYDVLGRVADVTGTTVVSAWNVVGLAVSCGLIAMSFAWARRLAPGTRAWVLAPAPFLLGTLYWWVSGTWMDTTGGAVLWPPIASLYSPGAESPALLLAAGSLLVLALALHGGGRRRIVQAAVGGAAAGLALHAHANVFIFGVVAAAGLLVADYVLRIASRARRQAMAVGGVAALAAALAVPDSGFAARLGVLLVAVAAALASDPAWRTQRGLPAAVWAGAAVVATLPLSVRIAAQVLSGNSYYYDRQASITAADVDLPIMSVLLLMLPLWALAGSAVWKLARRPASGAAPGWLPLLLGLCAATALTFAGRLGAVGLEWNRFLVYGGFMTAMAAFPALWLLMTTAERVERALGGVVAALCVATLPAIASFADAQCGSVACVPAQEVNAYAEIGREVGTKRLMLLDRCMIPWTFKVYSGARVSFLNLGIAAPRRVRDLQAILVAVGEGRLPPDGALREIGVTSFLTHPRCGGVTTAEIRRRFGRPVARVALRDPTAFGLPPGFAYEVYDLP